MVFFITFSYVMYLNMLYIKKKKYFLGEIEMIGIGEYMIIMGATIIVTGYYTLKQNKGKKKRG